MRALLLVQLTCTLAMTGLIWFVQIAHYPLLALVDPTSFTRYEVENTTRTGWVVGPLMCVELATAVLMLSPRLRPAAIPASAAIAGTTLVAILWLSTALIQVPLHNRLSSGYSAAAIAALVATNWIRTLAWTARSALLLTWLARLIRL
jgi:hypothetical protein